MQYSKIWGLLSLSFLLITMQQSDAQTGIDFFHGSFEEAKALAKKEHKLIFMDAYATWCGPCKKMARDVFTDKSVGEFFNKHFVNLKMDMEKGEGPTLALKYRVSAYPTLLFIDPAGEVVNLKKGALPADRFIALGKATLSKNDKSGDFEAEYEKGNRAAEFLRSYAYALKVGGKPTLKIANEYLKTQETLNTRENLEFIFDFATEADCRVFNKLIKYRKEILEFTDADNFKNQVQKACEVTIEKSVKYQTPELLKEAKKQMKQAIPEFASEFNLLADIKYAYLSNDMKGIVKTTDKYVKKFAKGDADKLQHHAQLFYQYISDKKALKKAEQWAEQAYKLVKNNYYGKTYLDLLRKNGEVDKAKQVTDELKTLP